LAAYWSTYIVPSGANATSIAVVRPLTTPSVTLPAGVTRSIRAEPGKYGALPYCAT